MPDTLEDIFMIVVQEKEKLDEMSRLQVSSMSDDLPFRIVVNSPDHQPPHAHIMDNETGKKELGQFLIPATKPGTSFEVEDYKQGISDGIRTTISLWMRGKSKLISGKTNWESLCIVWRFNEKH
jgi:hypothetical protein